MLDNAKAHGLPLAMTFIDLRNAFLHHIKVPPELSLYIHNLYSNLSAFISTKQWITDMFPIERGVFQGDTLSPLIFLLCFNPIFKLAQSLQGKGFSLHLPVPSSEGLPPVGSHFYVEWNEVDSPDPSGFYLCSAIRYHSDGSTTIQYVGDGATELVDLHSIFWSFTRKTQSRSYHRGLL